MSKKPTPSGDIQRLRNEEFVLELPVIGHDTPLRERAGGRVLIARPDQKDGCQRVRKALERLMEYHNDALRKLAE